MTALSTVNSPQLQLLHRGKVRDSFRVDAKTRLIVVTDRISAFDLKLDTPIPGKGEVLNRLAAWWFAQTADIVPNHLLRTVGRQASLVREAVPMKIEVIVRGYMAGSMARGYREGRRSFSGVAVPDGLRENDRLPQPIVTPTTKEESDQEITPDQIVAQGLLSAERYAAVEGLALRLFNRGTELLAARGLLLADTKYEFGLVDDQIVLIDEIHTPDSSRIWDAARYALAPAAVPPLDKEFVRTHMMAARARTGAWPRTLPPDIVAETLRRYAELYTRVTQQPLTPAPEAGDSLREALVAEGLIKAGFVAIVMGSPKDRAHAEKLRAVLAPYDLYTVMRVVSAHKNGERIAELVATYGETIEPGVIIAVAGESNGLGGALAANFAIPVINAPPFSDRSDVLLNVASSLMMPSATPAATCIRPDNAAHAALRALNIPSLRRTLAAEIRALKQSLIEADAELSGLSS